MAVKREGHTCTGARARRRVHFSTSKNVPPHRLRRRQLLNRGLQGFAKDVGGHQGAWTSLRSQLLNPRNRGNNVEVTMKKNCVQYLNGPRQSGCYVYVFRIDGAEAYVGKGSNGRLWDHERAALHHKRKTRWQVVLASAIRRGKCITAEIVGEGMTADEANTFETQLIAKFGRLDLGTGTLFNRTAGGDGLTSEDAIRVFSNPKTRRKLLRARRRQWRDSLFRARLSIAQKRSWSDPKMRPHRLAVARATLARPGVREKQKATCAITNRRPDVHARRSEAAKALHRDPAYREKLYTALRRAAKRPKRKAQLREAMRKRNRDPEYTRKRLEGIQRYWKRVRARAGAPIPSRPRTRITRRLANDSKRP